MYKKISFLFFVLLLPSFVFSEISIGFKDQQSPQINILDSTNFLTYSNLNETITGNWTFNGSITIINATVVNQVNSSDYWDDLDTPADIGTSELNNDAGFISSYTESDTLQTVTDRGFVTTHQIQADSFFGDELILWDLANVDDGTITMLSKSGTNSVGISARDAVTDIHASKLFQFMNGQNKFEFVQYPLYATYFMIDVSDTTPVLSSYTDTINISDNVNLTGNLNITGNISASYYITNLLPNPTLTHDIGSEVLRWGDLYVSDISADDISVYDIIAHDLTLSGNLTTPFGNFSDLIVGETNLTEINSTYVPYTGANSNIDLGTKNLETNGNIEAGIFKSNNFRSSDGTHSFIWNSGIDAWYTNEKLQTGNLNSNQLNIKSQSISNFPLNVIRSSTSATLGGFWENADGDGEIYLTDVAGNYDVKLSTNAATYFNGGNVGVGTTTPGVNVAGGGVSPAGTIFHLKNTSSYAQFFVEGNFPTINLVDYGGGSNDKMMQLRTDAGITKFMSLTDTFSAIKDNIFVMDIGNGNVGIGTATPSFPLEIGSNISGISIYSQANVSATGYITRTTIYDKTKGDALDLIKDSSELKDKNNIIDHKKFYGYTTYNVTDYSRPEQIEKCHNETIQENVTITKEVCDLETIYPYQKVEEGIEITSEIELLRQAVYELKNKVKELESKVK